MKTKTVIQLTKNECANYFYFFGSAGNNYCCLIDNTCSFFTDDDQQLKRCNYFERSVLPLDVDLQYQYRQQKNIKTDPQRVCKRCTKPFNAKNNREKYCAECKRIRKREQTKLSVRKYRKAV